MKKLHTFLYISVFFVSHVSFSQNKQMLDVGQPAPKLTVQEWITGTPLMAWKPGHYYIIEFGSTWCKPCIAAIPEMAKMQSELGKDVSVISLFVKERKDDTPTQGEPRYVSHVKTFVKKRAGIINYTVGVDTPEGYLERAWLTAAGETGIPRIFIVDGSGIIRWIGISPLKARETVLSFINHFDGTAIPSVDQPKVKYDPTKLFLVGNNGGNEEEIIFRSMLTAYQGKIKGFRSMDFVYSYQSFKPDSVYDQYEDKMEVLGASVSKLYYMAYADSLSTTVSQRYKKLWRDTVKMPHTRTSYGKQWHKPVLEVKDTLLFQSTSKSTMNRFNYSLKVPKGTGTARFMQQAMRRDLDTYFGFKVEVQTRMMPYWKLSAPDKGLALSKLKSKDQTAQYDVMDQEAPYKLWNAEVRDIIVCLAGTYGFGSLDYGKVPLALQTAFIDETGIKEKIDFTFSREWTFEECKKYLSTLGLEITRSKRNMKVVVIKDADD